MAVIIVKGDHVDVEIVRIEPEVGLAFFTFACDRGAWCSVPLPDQGTVRAWIVAVQVAGLHADTEH